MAKAKGPVQERAQLLTTNATQDPATGIWTYVPPSIEQVNAGLAKWRPIWCAGYHVTDAVCGKLVDFKGNFGVSGFKGKRLPFCSIECRDEFLRNWRQYVPDDAALDKILERHYHHIECIPCHCPPGPQIQATQSRARETALWGGRDSAKSESTFPFLTGGNKDFDREHPTDADSTYLNCPDYTFLVIRKNAKDLINYFSRAVRYFKFFGGEATYEPMGIRFPRSGAFGICDHMADGTAWEKYQGPEWTRMVIEEAPQLGEEIQYLKLIASCRTSNPQMKAQIMLTANPGGAGWRWFKARFLEPEGKRLKSNEPYTDPYSGHSRVHIFSTVDDNPLALSSGGDKNLDIYRAADVSLYKQWRFGDPDAVAGQFFEMFREKWNRESGEPENACHVIPPQKLDRYWPRAIGVDWGYKHPSAVSWGCWHPKRQLHIYREMLVSRMGCVELGAEIARRSLPELQTMAVPHINLFLSHDAFNRENETATEAEQIKQGIERILGPDAAFLLAPDEEEELLEDEAAWASIRKRQVERSRATHITIINAGKKRRGNMSMIRQYLRWWPIQDDCTVFDPDVARRIVITEGALAYHEYKSKCEHRSEEVVPVLQIHHDPATGEGCPRLIAAMQAAVEAENDPEQMQKQDGDDFVDSLAYLIGNFTYSQVDLPRDIVVSQKLAALGAMVPGMTTGSLIMASRTMEAAFSKKNAGHAYALPSRRNRRPQMVN